MRTTVRLGSVMFSPLLLAALLQAASTLPAQAAKTVQIGEIGNAARISLNVGDDLRVILKATVSTGYSWRVARNDNAVLAADQVANLPSESKLAGATDRQSSPSPPSRLETTILY